eukprot:TRINITY_DN577_c0_g1_i2.p1 TRINITY_DN577_c0_g1~~TRINITY_DN577_c0_g1_i2.p1  ORF type:complete len:620 (-),score=125.08 TRINITY_DN577_c0_g1_i2:39-1898(-)
MEHKFKVGIYDEWTAQAKEGVQHQIKEILLSLKDVELEVLPDSGGVAVAEVIDNYDALVILNYQFTAESFKGLKRLSCIARWGVGFDRIDTQAATTAGVAVAITPPAVRRPVAEAIIAFVFALAKTILPLDKRTREGRWREGFSSTSIDIEGKTLGSIGLGNIGAEMARIARGVGLARVIAYDPFISQQQATPLGVTLVDFDTVFKESDFVCVNIPLTEKTTHLVSEREFSLMKPTAYFINTSRGPIVKETALINALKEKKIAGAGIDVFEQEPPAKDNPLFSLDNVVLAPHSIAWTQGIVVSNSQVAVNNVKEIYEGKCPKYLANPLVRENALFLEKIGRRKLGKQQIQKYIPPTFKGLKVNKILQNLSENKGTVGHMVWEFATRGIHRLVENAGVDFVLLDMEHSGFGIDKLSDLLSFFSGTDVTAVVRVPIPKDYTYIARIMDSGAQGIMAPNVKNPEEAKFVLDSMKYTPKGRRGLAFSRAHSQYLGPSDLKGFMEQANHNSVFIAQIESKEGVDNVEEIAAIDGVDVLWIGHFDLSSDLGIVGQFHHPIFMDAIKKVVAAGKKYNKGLGIQPNSALEAKEWINLGFNIVSWGADSVVYQNALMIGVDLLRSSLA